jgi:Na+/melibiose symporter-like transporter
MTGVMTGDVNERTSLSSYRFVSAMIAQLVVGGFTLPLVAKFGHGDNTKGWQMTMGLWAIVCVVLLAITFLTTRERILPDPKQKSSAKEDFSNLLKNGPWIAMFVLALFHFIFVAMRGGSVLYFFQYYLNQDRLFEVLNGLGLTSTVAAQTGMWHSLLNTFGLIVDPNRSNLASVGVSFFNMSSQFVTVLGVLCSTALAIRFGKKAIALWGFGASSIFMGAFMLLPADGVWSTFLLEYARVLTYSPTIPLIWAMFADVADFAEWKTGRRTTGVIYATIMFGLKAGLSLGGAILGWVLGAYGYRPNVAQTPDALFGIRMSISIFPAICFLIVLVCLVFYPIGKKLNLQIQDELAERRRKFATQ